MRIAWILGWATPRAWFEKEVEAVFPNEGHVYFQATAETWERVEKSGRFDCLAGYSLGSYLLLEDPERAARVAPRIALFAPIFAFVREAGRGGKIARAQVRYLARWLRRDPSAALADFSNRAGLDLPPAQTNPVSLAQWEWGLQQLEKSCAGSPAPSHWEVYGGTNDPLLDFGWLRTLDPAIRAVEGGAHHPRELLKAWARSRSLAASVSAGPLGPSQSGMDAASTGEPR